MFRRKPKEKESKDIGFLHADTDQLKDKVTESYVTQKSYQTNRGDLEFREEDVILKSNEGDISIPYHKIDVWDYTGKKFSIWYRVNNNGYFMECSPKVGRGEDTPSDTLKKILHQQTFVL